MEIRFRELTDKGYYSIKDLRIFGNFSATYCEKADIFTISDLLENI
jgi:hypothetical protein